MVSSNDGGAAATGRTGNAVDPRAFAAALLAKYGPPTGMIIDMGDEGGRKRAAAASPPKRLRSRRTSPIRLTSLQEIEAKLQSAERNRRERLQSISRKAARSSSSPGSSPSKEKRRRTSRGGLEWKLEAAAEKRNGRVEQVRSKATYFLMRRKKNLKSFEVASQRRSRQLEEKITEKDTSAAEKRRLRHRAFQLKSKGIDHEIRSIAEKKQATRRRLFQESKYRVDSAEQARQARLKATSRRAAEHVAYAKAVAQKRRQGAAATKIQRRWRAWRDLMPLSSECARDVLALGLSTGSPADNLMRTIQQKRVMHIAERMLSRVGAWMEACNYSMTEPESLLLQKAVPPSARAKAKRTKGAAAKSVRFPSRILLCSFLIVGHPEVVLNGGESETELRLRECSHNLIEAWEHLLRAFAHSLRERRTALVVFRESWDDYLARFVEWKTGDAAALEHDLVLMACRLRGSMLSLCGRDALDGKELSLPDHETIRLQTIEDLKTLRSHVMKIACEAGASRFDDAISNVDAQMMEVLRLREELEAASGDEHTTGALEAGVASSNGEEGGTAGQQSDPNTPPTPKIATGEPKANSNMTSPLSSPKLLKARIMHELLHDPDWQLVESPPASPNSGDEAAKSTSSSPKVDIQGSIVLSKDRVNGVRDSLLQTPADPRPLCSLLNEIANELSESLPENLAVNAKLRAEVDACFRRTESIEEFFVLIGDERAWESRRLAMLLSSELGTSLVDRLERAATLVRNLSAPIRDQDALSEFEEVKEQVNLTMERVANEHVYSEALRHDAIDSVLNTVKFLVDQICLLKRDIANALLRQLSLHYQREEGPTYVHEVLAEHFGVSASFSLDGDDGGDDIGVLFERMPRTFSWMMDAVDFSDGLVEKFPIDGGGGASQRGEAAGDGDSKDHYGVPSQLRTGFTMPLSPVSSPSSEGPRPIGASQGQGRACISTVPEYFHQVVRLGILKSVIGSSAAVQDIHVPECLQFDLVRIFESQEMFQRLLVKTCATLILRQRPLGGPAMSTEEMRVAVHKLDVIFKSEINMDQLGAQVAALAAPPGSCPSAEDEALVMGLMRRALDSSGPTFTIVFNSIEAAMQYLLRFGTGNDAHPGEDTRRGETLARAALKKVGTSEVLFEDVLEISAKIARMAEIQMAENSVWFFRAYLFLRSHLTDKESC